MMIMMICRFKLKLKMLMLKMEMRLMPAMEEEMLVEWMRKMIRFNLKTVFQMCSQGTVAQVVDPPVVDPPLLQPDSG